MSLLTRGSPDAGDRRASLPSPHGRGGAGHGAPASSSSRPGCTQPVPTGARRRPRRQPHRVVGRPVDADADRRRRPAGRDPPPAARRRRTGPFRTALQRPLDQPLYRRCDLLIAASTALAHELVDDHGLPGGTGAASSNQAATCRRTRCAAGDLRPGRRIAVLCVGNWLPNKGMLELLDAVAALPADRVTLHLAGRDRRRPRLRRPGAGSIARTPTWPTASSSTGCHPRRGGRALRRCRRVRRSRATSRRTERCSPRRWRPGSPRRLALRQPAEPHRGRPGRMPRGARRCRRPERRPRRLADRRRLAGRA